MNKKTNTPIKETQAEQINNRDTAGYSIECYSVIKRGKKKRTINLRIKQSEKCKIELRTGLSAYSVTEGVGNRVLLYTIGGNVNWQNHFGENFGKNVFKCITTLQVRGWSLPKFSGQSCIYKAPVLYCSIGLNEEEAEY